MPIAHYPPRDREGTECLRAATVAWGPLLGELHGVGLRPYLELERGHSDDVLRLYCELDAGLLLELGIADEGLPDRPPDLIDGYWTVFVEDERGYLAEVTIDPSTSPAILARKLHHLIDAVAAGERPLLTEW